MCILLFGCTDNCVCAERFYACAHVPASSVDISCACETRNERKELVGRRVCQVEIACLPRGKPPHTRDLLDRFVLNVVLCRVFVRQSVDDVESLAERIVDLHERLPLLRERVLREDRLDRTFGFARTA